MAGRGHRLQRPAVAGDRVAVRQHDVRRKRFILAFLYSQSSGDDRSAFDGFWKAATRPRRADETEATAARARGIHLKREANRICLAVGEQPKEIQDRFWDELTRDAYARGGEEVTIMR